LNLKKVLVTTYMDNIHVWYMEWVWIEVQMFSEGVTL